MPINDKIILKKVKAVLLLDKVTKDYKTLLKSGPREFEKSLQGWNYENGLLLYREKVYIPHSMKDTIICHPPNTQVGRRPISWSPEITGGLG